MLLNNVGKYVRHPAVISRSTHERAHIRKGDQKHVPETGDERRRKNQTESFAERGRTKIVKRSVQIARVQIAL